MTALMYAAMYGYMNVAQLLMDKGADINTGGKQPIRL
jgi:ankyrin repeat protein